VTALDPGYGETPLEPDEADALTDTARELLGEDPSRADVYDAEQAISDEVSVALLTDVVDGRLAIPDLLTDTFVRELHKELYADIWTWAGRYRLTEKSVGIDPSSISVELRSSLQTIAYRWEHTDDWTAREFGIAVHADAVRIHPFVDGNGRSTRLLANLVFVAAQESDESLLIYDWDVEKRPYVDLLRTYDRTRDPAALAAFIPVTLVS
jgi:fido (protein-threonine AMPylation protein)